MKKLRLMTYNIHAGRSWFGNSRLDKVYNVIKRNNPDIVALQEVEVNSKRSGFVDQAARLGEDLKMYHYFTSRFQHGAEQYGLALLSRIPLKRKKADDLPTWQSRNRKEKTRAMWMSFEWDNIEWQIINTHFVHGFGERWGLVSNIISEEWLGHADAKSPLILCGDLNSTCLSPIYWRIRRILKDAQSKLSLVKNPLKWFIKTWPNIFPLVQIDHVFVSPEVFVHQIHVDYSSQSRAASDHLPLIADMSHH